MCLLAVHWFLLLSGVVVVGFLAWSLRWGARYQWLLWVIPVFLVVLGCWLDASCFCCFVKSPLVVSCSCRIGRRV